VWIGYESADAETRRCLDGGVLELALPQPWQTVSVRPAVGSDPRFRRVSQDDTSPTETIAYLVDGRRL